MDLRDEAAIDLLRRAAHDAEALDALLRNNLEFLRRHAEHALGKRLAAQVGTEDLVQDVLERVHRSIAHATFADERAFRSWLLVLIKNRALDLEKRLFRTQRRGKPARSLDETVTGFGSGSPVRARDLVPSLDPSPSSVVGRREQADSLGKVLERIPESYREIIRLTRLEGLSTEEVAARLGKTPVAVRKTLSRAIQSCREAMGLSAPREPT